ncbi:MAG: acyltransferase [Lachnospiraceae bacterium]|nr:acyltransferase [Lachnospiraceae bacterium]
MAKENSSVQFTLTKEMASSLKGLSAVEIMLGHIGLAWNLPFLYPFRKAGVLFVGLFFFLSGYGLFKSKENNPNYFKRFLLRRLLLLLAPAYLLYVFGEVCITPMVSPIATVNYVLTHLQPKFFFESLIWFIEEIAVFYVLFYLCYRFFKTKTANILMTAITLIAIVVLFILDKKYAIGATWYESSLCFVLGIFYAQKEQECVRLVQEKWILKNVIFLLVETGCIGGFFILKWENAVDLILLRNAAAIFFCGWVITLLQKVRIDYKPLVKLGEASYEIFLLHNAIIYVCSTKIRLSSEMQGLLTVVITILLALLLHIPLKALEKLIRKI